MHDLMHSLDEAELDELDRFLLNRGYDAPEEAFRDELNEGVINISELDGFLTAIISGPLPVMPSQWLPALWGDVPPQWKTEQAFEHIIGLVMRHLNGIANSLMDSAFEFEPLFLEREVEGQLYTIVDEWCVGYLRGIGLAQAQWREGEDELAEYLAPILLFADEKGWETLKTLSVDEVTALQQEIPAAVRAIHTYWLERRDAYRERPVVSGEPKIGRNDPCPCGSGKKYKQCCLH